jgi:hypothetical protein
MGYDAVTVLLMAFFRFLKNFIIDILSNVSDHNTQKMWNAIAETNERTCCAAAVKMSRQD